MVLCLYNKFEELENCWLVGGGIYLGSGLLIILELFCIMIKFILKRDG